MFQNAFMLLLVCSPLLAEKETARAARAFRTFPQNLLGRNIYPTYHIPNVHGPGTYAFGYEVEDPATRNLQFRDEEKLRDGTVRGAYGMLMPDGVVYITKYVADGFGYRTNIEKHDFNELLQSLQPSIVGMERLQPPQSLLPPMMEPILPYSIPGINNNVQNDNSQNNGGVFGWVGNLGQNIQNAFRPPPAQGPGGQTQGPIQNFFRPITSLFNPPPQNENPNNNGGLFGFINNIPFIGNGNRPQQQDINYNNVEQFSPIQVTSHPPIAPIVPPTRPPINNFDYDYDIPIVRPLAVNSNQHTYSNFLRLPPPPEIIPIADEIMLASESQQDGWFKKLMKRRRLQQQLKKEAKKEIKKVVKSNETPEIITN